MYIVLLVINIILMLFIIYGKIKMNLNSSRGKNILFGIGIFCSVGSLALIETQEASIMYSVVAIILYCIFIYKSSMLSKLNFNNTSNNYNNINNSTYTTSDGILVDDNDHDSVIIYRPIGTYMSLEDAKLVDKHELPRLNPSNLILQNDEYCCFMDDGKTFKQKTITTGYVNKRQGGSVRIMKGVSYHAGSGHSEAVRETQTEIFDGTIYITNKRLIYVSKGGDSFDKAIPKLTSVEEAEDGVIIQIGSKTYSIILDTHVLFMQVFSIVKNKEYGAELPETLTKQNVHFSSDHHVTEIQARQKNKTDTPNINTNKTADRRKTMKYLIWLIVIFVILFVISKISTLNNQKDVINYTDTQIINLSSHPRIYSNFEDTVSFYKTVDNKKVKISKEHAYYQDDQKHLIYMEKDNYNQNIITDIRLYLDTSSEYNDIGLETAVNIALDYLPLEIIENYYKFKVSFKESTKDLSNTLTKYYYEWEINDNGEKYRNKDTNIPLSNELSFKIYQYSNNKYEIFIGNAVVTANDYARYLDGKCDKWSFKIK